jgi:hypothetical protein
MSSMSIDGRWILLLAVAAGAVAVTGGASRWRRRHRRTVHDLQHKTDVKAWENEGGNVMPPPAAPVLP